MRTTITYLTYSLAEMSVPYVTLYLTGQKLPQVGMGTWKLDNNLCEETIYQAIKLGYRHFDAACDYGNEVEVGLGVKKAIEEGIVRREDLFITSKVRTSTSAATFCSCFYSFGTHFMQKSTSSLLLKSSSRTLVSIILTST